MKWYERFGYYSNPFETNSFKSHFRLIGVEDFLKEINYSIVSGNILLIEGKSGNGKTALLRYVMSHLRNNAKIQYLDAKKINKRFSIDNLFSKKEIVLLIDNVEHLTKKNNEIIKYYYDCDFIKSVIFATKDYNSVNFSDSLKDRVGKNIIKLDKLSLRDVMMVLKNRFYSESIFPNDVVKKIYDEADNVRDFLVRCDLLCEKVVKSGKFKSELRDLNRLAKTKKRIDVKDSSNKCLRCESELKKIKEHYRCEKCDLFCMHCGYLICHDDRTCPKCDKNLGGVIA